MPQHQPPQENPSSPSASFDADFMRDTAFVPSTIGETMDGGDAAMADPSPASPPFPPELIEQGLGPTFNVLFDMIAQRRGEHWHLKEFERDGLVKAWAPLVAILLSRLGSTEQGMVALALMTTGAVVGGKVTQDGIKRASMKASIRTRESADSSAYSVSGAAAKQPAQSSSYEERDDS